MAEDVTVAILAGGRSRRMGTDKSFVLLDGKPLIEHVIQNVSRLNIPVILITNAPEKYVRYDLPMYPDVYPDRGALGGLYTALYHCSTEYALCVACDMPFLNPRLLQFLIDSRQGYAAVAPCVDGQIENLHAVYSRSCLDAIKHQIDAQRLRLGDLHSYLYTKFIPEDQLRTIDPDLRSFVNLNTPENLRGANEHVPSDTVAQPTTATTHALP